MSRLAGWGADSVAEHQVVQTEKVRQVFQVGKAVTLDHNHIQAQVEVAEEPP